MKICFNTLKPFKKLNYIEILKYTDAPVYW